MTTLILIAAWVSVACLSDVINTSKAYAVQSVPYQMNFQGRLNNASGAPMAAGTYNMIFRIYSAATGGSALWTETRAVSASQGVTITSGGLFSVQLGSVTSLPSTIFNTSSPLYLEVELPSPATATTTSPSWTEGPMGPRNPIVSSPFAVNSDLLDGLDSSAFAAASGSANYIQNQGASPQAASFNISGTAQVGGNLTASGQALFKNGTNSTSAFSIQDASGNALLGVDTANGTITLATKSTYPVTLWGDSSLGDEYNSASYDNIAPTSDGGWVSTGSIETQYGSGPQKYYAFIAKYDASGTNQWNKVWGSDTTGGDYGDSIKQTSDGGYIMAGQTNYGSSATSAFLAKFDSSGNNTWSKTWGGTGTGYEQANSVVQTSDGGYAITGTTTSFSTGGSNVAFLAKFDSSGTNTWSKTWGTGTGGADGGNSLVQTADGGYAIAGWSTEYASGDQQAAFLAKFDSSGNNTWSKTWGSATSGRNNTAFSVKQTIDGGYIIAGQTNSFVYGVSNSQAAFLAKFDSSGNNTWSKTVGDGLGSYDYGYSAIQTSDGGYALVEQAHNAAYSNTNNVLLTKFDSTGNSLWGRLWGNATYADGGGLIQTSDGGLVVTGSYSGVSPAGNSGKIMNLKFDSSGNMANCYDYCTTNPTLTITSPTATITSPTAASSSPTATITSPTAALHSYVTGAAPISSGGLSISGATTFSSNVTIASVQNAASAFQVINGTTGRNYLNVDATTGTLTLTSATANAPSLVLSDSSGYSGIEFRAGGYSQFIGDYSGVNSTGSQNTGTGGYSMRSNTTGYYNSAYGNSSSYSNTTGNYNTALGTSALYKNTTGSGNTAIGYNAGNCDTSSYFCSGATLQNATAVGTYAQVTQNNSLVLGSVDQGTKVGIGITSPSNLLSVSPVDINSATSYITASQTSGSGTITASGAIFSPANVGELLVWNDGTTETITAYTSSTAVIGSNTTLTKSGLYFRTHHVGLQVTSTGNTYVQGGNLYAQNSSTNAFQVQNAVGAAMLNVDTISSTVTVGTTGYVGGTIPTSSTGSIASGYGGYSTEGIISGGYMYTARQGDSMKIFNISTPSAPTVASSTSLSGFGVADIAVSGQYAYIIGGNGLRIYNVSNPASPSLAGSLAGSLGGGRIQVVGNYAFVVDASVSPRVVRSYDISNPASPTLVSSVTSAMTAIPNMTISGNYLYTDDTASHLEVYSIATPTALSRVASITTNGGGQAQGIAISGTTVYVKVGNNGISVQAYDVSTPSTPTYLGVVGDSVNLNGGNGTFTVSGSYLFFGVTGGSSKIEVFDISKGVPIPVTTSTATGALMATQGRYMYLMDNTYTLGVYDMGNNANLTVNGQVSLVSGTNSTTAFQIQNAAGVAALTVDTTTNTITLGSGSNTITFTASGGLLASGTARHTKTILLTPEYAGAVLDAASDGSCSSANSGTMTSGLDNTNRMNYYNWTSTSASAQCYDVVVQVPIPADFNGWASAPDIRLSKDSTGTASYAINVTDSTGTTDTNYNYSAPGTLSTSWANMATSVFGNNAGTNGTTSYVPGSYFTIKVRVSSTSSANVKLGNIKLTYSSTF